PFEQFSIEESGIDRDRWLYQGDDNQRSLEVDSGMKVPIGDNGGRIFTGISEEEGVTTFSVVEDLVHGLNNYTPGEEGEADLDELLASTLTNLDDAQSRILEVRAEVGARLNTIESTREFHADS